MTDRTLVAQPLTVDAFAPFGDVIDTAVTDARTPINGGRARRLPPLAEVVATGDEARVLISLVEGDPYTVPLRLDMVERHPFGSQAFIPLSPKPFLVVVCPDEGGRPGTPHVFLTAPHQGINYHRNVWHGVLTPLDEAQTFIVVDRGGAGTNLEEHFFEEPWTVRLG